MYETIVFYSKFVSAPGWQSPAKYIAESVRHAARNPTVKALFG